MILCQVISTFATVSYLSAAHGADFGERRSNAAAEFHDGIPPAPCKLGTDYLGRRLSSGSILLLLHERFWKTPLARY